MPAKKFKPRIGEYSHTYTIYGCKDSINALSISGDGKYLIAGGDDGLIRVFSLSDYTELCQFQGQAPVLSLAWLNQFSLTFLMGDILGDIYTIRVLPAATMVCA